MEADDLSAWVASSTGETVVTVTRIASGYSRATYDVTSLSGRRLVARLDSALSPMHGTGLSLEREAIVHRALHGTDIPRARLLAHADGAMLFERVTGTHLLDQLAAAARRRVVHDYMDRLGDLHSLRLDALDLPDPMRAEAATDPLGADLQRWLDGIRLRVRRPWPFLELAVRMLRDQAPPIDPAKRVLLHGDVGPGNFLHDGRRVTALLDWEFWHFGDPADDLAWWIWRAHERFPSGNADLRSELAQWSGRSGHQLDGRRVDYYQIVVRLRSLVVAAVALDNRTPGVNHSVLLPIVWTLTCQIARGLIELSGETLAIDPAPEAAAGADLAADALEFLRADVAGTLIPEAATDTARRQSAAVLTYAEHLHAVAQYGASVAAADDADLRGAGLAGFHADAPVPDGRAALDLLQVYGRIAFRRAWLWPTAFARMPAEPIRVADLVPASGDMTTVTERV